MANRHALLIGVPRYDDEEFNDARLDAAVRSDIDAMRSALAQSDYTVKECGIDNADRGGATLSRINRAVEDACASAPAGSVLLIYFSGHGVSVDGTDYLVPSDGYRSGAGDSDGQSAIRGLIPAVPPDDVLRNCRAALVVFFVDACRDSKSSAQSGVEPGGQQPFLAGGGQFVMVMGCSAGQVGQYDETGSAFTQSLAKVLDSRNPARSLAAVIAAVTEDMKRRSRQSRGDPQEPVVRNPDVLMHVGGAEICDGDELTDAWRKAVDASPLLALCVNQELVRQTVAECARRCGRAALMLRGRTGLTDPWTDQDYPVRVLKNTEFLLSEAGLLPGAEHAPGADGARPPEARAPRPGEAALLIAAPFLREAVLAEGIRDAAAIDPANLDRTYIPGLRSDLELTHEMYPHLVRRAAGLRQRGDARPSDEIVLWLVHRWLTDRAKLWDEAGAAEICGLGATLIADSRSSVSEHEVPRLVKALLLAIGAEPTDERLLGKLASAYMSEDWRFLAAVLWLAGTMAADPRRLPPVVADLVGTRMELRLTEVGFAAGRPGQWSRGAGGVLNLDLACEHPALHDAFQDIVRRADAASKVVATRLSLPPALTRVLPSGFTDDGLRAATIQDNQAAYDVPLARFQVAEEKVREILMGRQLYGEPELAIRELYQNALDACRWRATRQEYLERTDQSPAMWSGLIRFTQGTDDGRPYIDCEDNGVGMDIDTLKHVFANAGERFVYGQEFRAEQAAWAELDPPLRMVSNSQFGVGVFSYFMLADEITVLTRHQRQDGVVERQAYEVRIASSGSLLQIRPAGAMSGGGTKVRLYLSGDALGTSVLETLRNLLRVSEHRVQVATPDGAETWEPGELRYPGASEKPLKYGDGLWWVPGPGGLAADGIKANVEFFGLIANLSSEQRPRFTVDRKTVSTWDAQWVAAQVTAAIPELMDWPGFSLSWLWRMARSDRARAREIFDHAVRAGKRVVVSDGFGEAEPVSLAIAGCLGADLQLLVKQVGGSVVMAKNFMAWRGGVWRSIGYTPHAILANFIAQDVDKIFPVRVAGFPAVSPDDGLLLGKWPSDWHNDSANPEGMLSAFCENGVTPEKGLRQLRKYAVTGLELSSGRRFCRTDVPISQKDADFLARFPLWSDAVKQGRAGVVAALTRAALSFERPASECLRQARAFRVLGWSSSAPEDSRLADDAVADAEHIVQLLKREPFLAGIQGTVGPAHLVRLSDESGLTIAQVIERCDELAVMGVTVTVTARDTLPMEPGAVDRQALKHLYEVGQSVDLAEVLLIAHEAGVTLGVAHDALARLADGGLLTCPRLDVLRDHVPTPPEIDLIAGTSPLRRVGGILRPEGGAAPWLRVAEVILGRHAEDEALGPAARGLLPLMTPRLPITYADLGAASLRLGMTIGEVAEKLHGVYPEIQLPEIPPECAELVVPWSGQKYRPFVEGYPTASWNFTAEMMVRAALASGRSLGSFVALLDPFRRLGADVPPFDEAVRDQLDKVKVDEYDVEMLQLSEPKPVITALRLVQAAGRFGWTLSQAHQRFAQLIPIGVTLGCPASAAIPDEIVYWYDLQALTTYFDGQEPATSGKLDWAYLEIAAVEIFDCPPEEIKEKAVFLRDRLRIYADLFELELPEGDTVD